MPAPTTTIQRRDIGDVVSEYALERSREGFVGEKMLPIFQTSLQTGNYPVISVEEMLKPRDVKRAAKGGYNRGDWGFEQGDYACQEYGWEEVIDDSLSRNFASYFDAEVMGARIATDVLLREYEKRVQTLADTATSHSVSVKWSTAATATPKANINAGIKTIVNATGMMPDKFVCTWQSFQNLLATTEMLDATKYTGGGAATLLGFEQQKRLVAQYFGVASVEVTNAVYNGNPEGSSSGFSATQIWTDAYGYLVVTGGGMLESAPAWGRTFLWTDDSPNIINVESYREDAVRGSVVRCRHYVDEKELNANCIYRLTNLA